MRSRFFRFTSTLLVNILYEQKNFCSSLSKLNDSPGSGREKFPILSYPLELVDTVPKLDTAISQLMKCKAVSIDVEAFCTPTEDQSKQLGKISLVQACAQEVSTVFLFDALTLGKPFFSTFQSLTGAENICKLFFDCRRDVEALNDQENVKLNNVLDLQLFFTATQWKLRSVNRRSNLTFVLKQLLELERQESDGAVQSAMTVGNRPVWDVRPLPPHFLQYAADDVRHILILYQYLQERKKGDGKDYVDLVTMEAVKKISSVYVQHYGNSSRESQTVKDPEGNEFSEGTVATRVRELDTKPSEVNPLLLERFLGPGGRCRFCHGKGHTEKECFRKKNVMTCSNCGQKGHSAANCVKETKLYRCEACGQVGHTEANCFRKNPCKYCGGFHRSSNCLQKDKKR